MPFSDNIVWEACCECMYWWSEELGVSYGAVCLMLMYVLPLCLIVFFFVTTLSVFYGGKSSKGRIVFPIMAVSFFLSLLFGVGIFFVAPILCVSFSMVS